MGAMKQYFDLPFVVDSSTSHTRLGKRRRETDDDRGDIENSDRQPPLEDTHSDHELVLPPNFPHEPLKTSKPNASRRAISPTSTRTLKQQHIAVLNTILHRSLLEHDWHRAGRAFGLLLRVDYRGDHLSLRHKGYWGIGAEILLQTNGAKPCERDSSGGDSGLFGEAGFKAAKSYYNRLILQYPFRKNRPHDTSATVFYPTMLGLWINEIRASTKRALADLSARETKKRGQENADMGDGTHGSDSSSSVQSNDDEENVMSNNNYADRKLPRSDTLEREHLDIKQVELREVRKLAEKVDDLTLAPPYDRDARLLQLQADITLWLADLLESTDHSMDEVNSQRQRADDVSSRLDRLNLEDGQIT